MKKFIALFALMLISIPMLSACSEEEVASDSTTAGININVDNESISDSEASSINLNVTNGEEAQ